MLPHPFKLALFACALIVRSYSFGSDAPVKVTALWETGWPLLTPSSSDLQLAFKNTTDSPQELLLEVSLTSPVGDIQELSQAVLLGAQDTEQVTISMVEGPYGPWELNYSLKDKATGNTWFAETKISFGYMDPIGPNDTSPDFYFGVVAHLSRASASEQAMEMLIAATAGCKVVRSNPSWARVQPQKDVWNWDEMDKQVAMAAELGMQLQVLPAYTPRWAAPADKQNDPDVRAWSRAAPDLDAWQTYIQTMAERYRGQIHLWETWNEPDLANFWRGSTEEYIVRAGIAVETLKAVDPENKVLLGGFATLTGHAGRQLNPTLQKNAMEALGTKSDFQAIHEHGPFDRFERLIDGPYAEMRNALPQPVPPLFFNETAISSAGRDGIEQAENLIKKASFARSRGAAGYLWYDLRNDGINPKNPEHHYGMVTHSMEPKPVYFAFNTFAREVVPTHFVRQLSLGEKRYFFLFEDDDSKLLVFWNDDDASQNEQIMLEAPGALSATVMDMYGNAEALPIAEDFLVVSSAKQPQFLRLPKAKSVIEAGKLISPERAFFGAPGEAVSVSCVLTNPFQHPVTVYADWSTPMAIGKVTAGPERLELGPNAQAVTNVMVRLPEGRLYRYGQEGLLRLRYRFEDTPYAGELFVPIHYGTVAVPAGSLNREPDIVLDKEEQLYSFVEADPSMIDERWHGPEDLSIKAWLTVDENDLILQVDVTDDVHFQNETDERLWNADSIQCMISVPGAPAIWELGFAVNNDNESLIQIGSAPDSVDPTSILSLFKVSAEPLSETTQRFHINIPRELLGLSDQVLTEGFRFNMAVNDNDGYVRAHALQLAPGIVVSKSTRFAPYLVIKP